jgi:hypothetical protein
MTARIRITRVIAAGEVADLIEPAMRRLLSAMHRRAQRVVPKRTFNLHDTLETDLEVEGSRVVGTLAAGGKTAAAPRGAEYALFIEQGTSRMKAQPYLRPALLQSRSADLNFEGQPERPRGGGS